MPTVLANALLSFVPDRSWTVRGPDRVAAVSPMFDEEAGAEAALTSLLAQRAPLDELVVSINGGTDATESVVSATLDRHGYGCVYRGPAAGLDARLQRWHRRDGPPVTVIVYRQPVAKSDSINAAVAGGFVTAERVLVVDGDTVFDAGFVGALKDAFYRLERQRVNGRLRFVLRDVALQSGAVQSARPQQAGLAAEWISRARSAEYAFSAVLRKGQTARLGRGPMLGATRLYTVVGCGFVARRDAFPMPPDTLTEDHDFTLAVQNGATQVRTVSPRALHERGFRVVTNGVERSLLDVLDRGDEVDLARTAEARFVEDALMFTEDPPHLAGYVRQLERWNGGGIENALKRLFVGGAWANVRPNVRFAVLAAQLENGVGLALLGLVPILLGMGIAAPGKGATLSLLAAWFGADLAATLALTALGFARLGRALGTRGAARGRYVLGSLFATVVPLFALKYLGAVAFCAAATRALPAFLRRAQRDPRVTQTWQRPRARVARPVHVRTAGVAATMLLVSISLFVASAHVASLVWPDYRTAWELTYRSPHVAQEDHAYLPIAVMARGASTLPGASVRAGAALDVGRSGRDGLDASDLDRVVTGLTHLPPLARDAAPVPPVGTEAEPMLVVAASPATQPSGVSVYCTPGFVAASAAEPHRLEGDVAAYRPLSPWGILVLARLAPLLTHLEEAATAYDVPARLLLQVLLNESYLDPLAVGPTGDLGLAQVTSDALTLLRAVSVDPDSALANARMFEGSFSVFDPDFSLCAGAAKLAWARSQPGGASDEVAYALYINPLEGAVRGRVSERHAALVAPMLALAPLVDLLSATVATYRSDPERVAPAERALLDVAATVSEEGIDLAEAYRRVADLAVVFEIDDRALYQDVLERLYGTGDTVSTGEAVTTEEAVTADDAVSTEDAPAEVPAG